MNLLKAIINWFKKDHAALSAKAVSAFDNIRKDLQKLNASASKEAAKAREEAAILEAKAKSLVDVVAKNGAVLGNIAKLLGEV